MTYKIGAPISDATDKVSSEFGIGCRTEDPMQALLLQPTILHSSIEVRLGDRRKV